MISNKSLPYLLGVFFSVTFSSCGINLYESFEEADPIEQAIIFLEQGKAAKAIEVLRPELNARPEDREVLSLMGSATALLHGIEPLGYALALAKPAPEGKNNVTKTFSLLPPAVDENIEGLQAAINFMLEISQEKQTPTDRFKLAMFNSALMALVSKKFSDSTGELTAESLASMTPEDAMMILSSLDNAEDALLSGAITGENSTQAANQVSSMKGAIENEPGANDVEKLQNYLASR